MKKIFNLKYLLTVIIIAAVILNYTKLYALDSEESEWTPLQLALFNPVQIFDEKCNVYGLRLNLIYGVNSDLYGIDIGMVNKAD
ncbi:MAG TPA: hypothetical protein PK986_11850, partial [Spirochaetota bacterium]|nr:hypothetical protein [Spirochaetota bacterium]